MQAWFWVPMSWKEFVAGVVLIGQSIGRQLARDRISPVHTIFSTTYRVDGFSSVSQNVSQIFLGRHLWCHFSSLIEGRTHQFKFRMLILHRSSHILVPHRLHHRR